jgi:steroid delta-isomerase-like uncharacterized protein
VVECADRTGDEGGWPMSEANKAVVLRLVEDVFNERRFELVDEVLAEDFVNHNPPPVPGIDAGRSGFRTILEYFAHAFPDSRAEAVRVLADGGFVVLHDLVRGTHREEFMGVPATGKQVVAEFIHIFRVQDGKLAERWGLLDAMSLMQQLGALPAPEPAPVD